VIGGLMLATFLTLFVLPVLYILFDTVNMKKRKSVSTLIVLLISLCTPQIMQAQTTLSLHEAIDKAILQNQQIKSERLKTAYTQALIGTAKEIPQTVVFTEFGQVNSALLDTKFGVSQTLLFPTVYKRQTELYNEQYRSSLLNVQLKEFELKKAVTQYYYAVLYGQAKAQILEQAKQLYTNFYNKASLRLQKGESNILEKTTAETQLQQITHQLKLVQQDINMASLSLQLLMNDEAVYKLSNDLLYAYTDTSYTHPSIYILQQEKLVIEKLVAVERSKLLPSLTLGYNNNSFRGVGPDNKTYDGWSRFHAGTVGLSIPIFTQAQRARIKAAQMSQQIIDNDIVTTTKALAQHKMQLLAMYAAQEEIVKDFEQQSLKNATLIATTADKQFVNGDINYLEYVMLTNEAINIKNNYIEAIKALNSTSIELQYLTSK
jgi:cobalt-zinc-cadmium resistance protein CzcA